VITSIVQFAVDGSRIEINFEADLSTPLSSVAFVNPRGERSAYPIHGYPKRRRTDLLDSLPTDFPEIKYSLYPEVEMNGGVLYGASVRRPVVTGGEREYSFGIWEGDTGCVSTSIKGEHDVLVDLFDRLDLFDTGGGAASRRPVDESIRPVRCLKEIVGFGLVEIKPLTPKVAASLPSDRGFAVEHGELFRVSASRRDGLLLITETASVGVTKVAESDDHLALASTINVTWTTPR